MTEIRVLVLDRFEGDLAVVIDEKYQTITIPRKSLPANSKEGDHLRIVIDGEQVLEAAIDHAETENARRRIEGKLNRLRRENR